MPTSLPTRVVETHVSRLFFVDDKVYKLKKAIHTGFLDFTARSARSDACHQEVELNRRFAPDIYLGVADVTEDGREVDHMVVMKRLADDRRLSALLDGPSADDELRSLAHLVATAHGCAPRSREIDLASDHRAVSRLWEMGLEQISGYAGTVLDERDVDRVGLLAREYLAGRESLFAKRITDGRACDGHGDIQAEDIFCLDDGPRLLDCLEFDDELRFGDVLNDVAFLAMDLERLGHRELADRFLHHYREFTADSWPRSLQHHYVAYRAHVRAKIACLRFDQGDDHAVEAARSLHTLALSHLEASRVRLIMVGGTPGTGKSLVSTELGQRLDAVVVSSDVVRDELQPERTTGVNDVMDVGRYEPRFVEAVYEELLRRAELLVSMGESVVLDASWLDPARRPRALVLGGATSTPVVELRCSCPADVAETRIRRRSAAGTDHSEAGLAVAGAMNADVAPWPATLHPRNPGSDRRGRATRRGPRGRA